MPESYGIPSELDHFKLISSGGNRAQRDAANELQNHSKDMVFIGSCMCALYQAATCHRKCHGGSHILEALAGRSYNVAISSYNLIILGLYDEALSLIRSLGEISNLISLSIIDKKFLREWLAADKKTRLQKFSPSKVRQKLEEKEELLMYADDEWYSDLCETYVHVTPNTRPNMHNITAPIVGGIYQKDGLNKSINELAIILGFISLPICKYFDFDDLFDEIRGLI